MPDNNTFTIKVAGRNAPTDMAAGQYLARCLDANQTTGQPNPRGIDVSM